jgi:hypothetical protein
MMADKLDYGHMLDIFAFQVKTLCQAKPGDKFGLSFFDQQRVDVFVSERGYFYFTYAGQKERVHVGSLENAINIYTGLCVKSFEGLPGKESADGK